MGIRQNVAISQFILPLKLLQPESLLRQLNVHYGIISLTQLHDLLSDAHLPSVSQWIGRERVGEGGRVAGWRQEWSGMRLNLAQVSGAWMGRR